MSRIFTSKTSKESPFLSSQVKLLAAQTLKIASINGFKELDDLEDELEAEIQWENRAHHGATLDKIRHKGEHLLHAKFCLLAIVILNVIDCCLVIGALLIEFHHMQNLIEMKDGNAKKFMGHMAEKYPKDVTGLEATKVYKLYEKLLVSDVAWSNGSACISDKCSSNFNLNCSQDYYQRSYVDGLFFEHGGYTHYIEEKISHILHYMSITILCILWLETMVKIFCTVPRFFKKKLEMFDAFVVLISLILDLVFIDGFLNLAIGEFVIAVTFILPWRIIRILNSLIVAVMEKERYTLKMLYKQKKKVDKANTEATEKILELEKKVGGLKAVCDKHNVPKWEVSSVTGTDEKTPSSALSKLALHAAGSLTPAPMSESSTVNLFLKSMTGKTDNTPQNHSQENGDAIANGHATIPSKDEEKGGIVNEIEDIEAHDNEPSAPDDTSSNHV